MFGPCTWMSTPHHRHPVVQGQSLQRPVGLTVLQQHLEVSLLMCGLGVSQGQSVHFLVCFLVFDLYCTTETLWHRMILKTHGVVVHPRNCDVPLHLLVIREVTWIVGCDEVGV